MAPIFIINAIAGKDWYSSPIPSKQRVKTDKKPQNTPIIKGIVFLKPWFTALVERIILFGPGVIAAIIAKDRMGVIK